MNRTVHILAAGALAGLLAACARAPAPTPVRTVDRGWQQEGEASWYGPGFHGKRTASGEIYDMEAMTAAHPDLPFGSVIHVVNLDNGRETRVRINDRGPFARSRIVDLSRAAARELGMLGSGTAYVRIEVLEASAVAPTRSSGAPAAIPATCTLVQIGAYRDRRNAVEAMRQLEAQGEPVRQVQGSDGVIRILAGPYETEAQTRLMLERHDGLLRPCDP